MSCATAGSVAASRLITARSVTRGARSRRGMPGWYAAESLSTLRCGASGLGDERSNARPLDVGGRTQLDVPGALASALQERVRIRQLGALGEHEIDPCRLERDAADQALVATIAAVADELRRAVDHLD